MKKQIEQVKEFNKVFGVKDVSPMLRYKMLLEEVQEYYVSLNIQIPFKDSEDKIERADALGDILYVVFGAVIDAGLEGKIEEIFNEIHRSNMSKIEDGVVLRREDGKVLKGKNYFKPNIEQILNK